MPNQPAHLIYARPRADTVEMTPRNVETEPEEVYTCDMCRDFEYFHSFDDAFLFGDWTTDEGNHICPDCRDAYFNNY